MNFYSLSVQYKLGCSAILSLLTCMIVLPIGILLITPSTSVTPELIKENSSTLFRFLAKLKNDDGVLILGTSETGNDLDSDNYWGFLQTDVNTQIRYEVFGGAGRSAGMYFPAILSNPEAFSNLKILYYVNPTYWRPGLNYHEESYVSRYISSNSIRANYNALLDRNMIPFVDPESKLSQAAVFETSTDYALNFVRDLYYHDLPQLSETVTDPLLRDFTQYSLGQQKVLQNGINPIVNATYSFIKGYPKFQFPGIAKDKTYRTNELKSFLSLCKEFNIKLTIYVGPYNKIMGASQNLDFSNDYNEVIQMIKNLCVEWETPYISGDIYSDSTFTFNDVQHTSKYGGWLAAKQIKEYYEKTN